MTTPSAQDAPVAGQITLRYWASARAAVGHAEEQVPVAGPVTLADLVAGSVLRNGDQGARSVRISGVLGCCSVLLGDQPVAALDPAAVLVQPGTTVEFLPPFAGG